METPKSDEARNPNLGLEAAVRVAEAICGLPAIATLNWCDRAATAFLAMAPSATATVILGQFDENGRILRQEATGAAGSYMAQVTTTVGRSHGAASTESTVYLDPSDKGLSTMRTGLAESRELGWAPGAIVTGVARAGTAASFGESGGSKQTGFGSRWEVASMGALFLGVVGLPGAPGRAIAVEVGVTSDGAPIGYEAEVLATVLPLLARRVVIAIGVNPIDASQWLTLKELRVLRHLLKGKSVREIAVEVERSPHTVHDHVKSLHRKLNARSRGELIARALGYLQPPEAKGEPQVAPSALSRSDA